MKRIICIILCCLFLLSVPMAMGTQAAGGKLVAITFDDGPSGYTTTLLDGLKSRGAKATFFVVGNRVNSYPNVMRRMVSEGHQIANHTTTHPNLNTLSGEGVSSELNTCEQRLKTYGGAQTYAIRPPYGNHNATVRARANGPLILWSVDTLDWQSRNATSVYNKIVNNTRDGSIVLLHDLYSTSVQGALNAIDTLKAQGYEFVTVNELFRRRGITMQKGVAYSSAYNNGVTLPAASAPKAVSVAISDVVGGKKVSLATATKGADIYYTTDGSNPTLQSRKYSGTITLKESATLKAAAYNEVWGAVTQKQINVPFADAPKASLEGKTLTLEAVKGTTIYYETNGSVPTKKSAVYTDPITINKQCSVLVRASGKADHVIHYTVTKHGALFTDVPLKSWYYTAVGEAEHRGIMKGTAENVFSPETEITRAMFVTALYRMSPDAEQKFADSGFKDVTKKWYRDAVNWARANGVVRGMSDTEFAPNAEITREQMCSMLHRYLKVYKLQGARQKRAALKDMHTVSSWAKKDVAALYEMGLINGMGDGIFAPKLSATRAQCAKLLVAVDDMK